MALSKCTVQIDAKGRETLAHGTALFPVACYHDNLRDFPVPWHWHDELELFFVSEGCVTASAGSEKFTLTKGQGFFVNAGVLHAVRSADSKIPGCPANKILPACRLHSIVFHPRLVGGSLDSIFWQQYLRPLLQNPSLKYVPLDLSLPWHGEALQCLEAAWQSCAAEKAGYEFEVRALLSRLLYLLFSHSPSDSQRPSDKALREAERIKRMLRCIQERYQEDLDISQIAASAGISGSEALRCFKSVIGTPPMRYLRQFRIQEAAALLVSSASKIGDIGALCGLPDTSYFTKVFREQMGCTPSEYRARYRKQK